MKHNLTQHEIHVWSAKLDWPKEKISRAVPLLSEHEQKRAARFVMDVHRDRYIASHAILHEILVSYLDDPLRPLQFVRNKHGKPYLANLPSGENVQFNMSDSQDVAVYAFALGREVGIDVEFMRPRIHFEELAKRFFSENERDELMDIPENERELGFYRCWARKEAYLKVIGRGLSFSLNRFVVSLKPGEGFDCLLEVDGSADLAARWSVGSVPCDEGYQAALAAEGAIKEIKYFRF